LVSKAAFAVSRLTRGISGYGMLELRFTEEELVGVATEERAGEARSTFNDHQTDPAINITATINRDTEDRSLRSNTGKFHLPQEKFGQDDTITLFGYQ
jgi:hypothetical protein